MAVIDGDHLDGDSGARYMKYAPLLLVVHLSGWSLLVASHCEAIDLVWLPIGWVAVVRMVSVRSWERSLGS